MKIIFEFRFPHLPPKVSPLVRVGLGYINSTLNFVLQYYVRGHGGTVVTHSPPTTEVRGSNPGPYVGKLVDAYRWSGVYSTES